MAERQKEWADSRGSGSVHPLSVCGDGHAKPTKNAKWLSLSFSAVLTRVVEVLNCTSSGCCSDRRGRENSVKNPNGESHRKVSLSILSCLGIVCVLLVRCGNVGADGGLETDSGPGGSSGSAGASGGSPSKGPDAESSHPDAAGPPGVPVTEACQKACLVLLSDPCEHDQPDQEQCASDCSGSAVSDSCRPILEAVYACVAAAFPQSVACSTRGTSEFRCGHCDAELKQLADQCDLPIGCQF